MAKWPERETDVAAPVVAWLRECGWEVFQEVVEAEPGLGISEVVAKVDHHYASKQSASGSLLSWARAGKLEGVTVRGGTKAEGKFRLYPSEWQGPLESREMLRSK